LGDVFAGWRWWPLAAVNRSAIVSLHEGDHMKLTRAPGQPLGDAVRSSTRVADLLPLNG
jgi:hypothetical protein